MGYRFIQNLLGGGGGLGGLGGLCPWIPQIQTIKTKTDPKPVMTETDSQLGKNLRCVKVLEFPKTSENRQTRKIFK